MTFYNINGIVQEEGRNGKKVVTRIKRIEGKRKVGIERESGSRRRDAAAHEGCQLDNHRS